MPYKSEAQRGYMHAAAERGDIDPKVVEEFDEASRGQRDLPYHVKKKRKVQKAVILVPLEKGQESFDFDEDAHPRAPKGGPKGGEFVSKEAETFPVQYRRHGHPTPETRTVTVPPNADPERKTPAPVGGEIIEARGQKEADRINAALFNAYGYHAKIVHQHGGYILKDTGLDAETAHDLMFLLGSSIASKKVTQELVEGSRAKRIAQAAENARQYEEMLAAREAHAGRFAYKKEAPAPSPVEKPPVRTGKDITDEEFQDMLQAAQDWRYLQMKNSDAIPENREKMNHARQTTKGDQDQWLMDRFNIEPDMARKISNKTGLEMELPYWQTEQGVAWKPFTKRPEPTFENYPELRWQNGGFAGNLTMTKAFPVLKTAPLPEDTAHDSQGGPPPAKPFLIPHSKRPRQRVLNRQGGGGEVLDETETERTNLVLDPPVLIPFEKALPGKEKDGHKTPPKGYPEKRKQYGDPENYKYPLDTEEHVRAAWSYLAMPKNAAKYTPEQVNAIKARIKRAGKPHGIAFEGAPLDKDLGLGP